MSTVLGEHMRAPLRQDRASSVTRHAMMRGVGMSKWKGPVGREYWLIFTVGWTIWIGAMYLINLLWWDFNVIANLGAFFIMAFIEIMSYINQRPVWDYVYSDHKKEGVLETVEAALGDAELESTRSGPVRSRY